MQEPRAKECDPVGVEQGPPEYECDSVEASASFKADPLGCVYVRLHLTQNLGFPLAVESPTGYVHLRRWHASVPAPAACHVRRGRDGAQATMAIDGIGASFGGFEAINVNAQDTVLVTGLGPVGLGAITNARYRNARVIGVEPAPWGAQRALEMGAVAVLDPRASDILDQIVYLTDGQGVDCAVDCSGRVSAERLCIDATRRRGRVAFVGESGDDLTIKVSRDMIRKGLTVAGSWLYNRADYPKVMKVIQESPLIDLLISHQMPMSQIQEGFEILARGEGAKIVVDPWQ